MVNRNGMSDVIVKSLHLYSNNTFGTLKSSSEVSQTTADEKLKKKKVKRVTKKALKILKGKYIPGTRRNKKRPDICDICRLTMTHKDELIHHLLKIHKVEYKCKQCGKLYKSRKNLASHEKIHTAPKEFICEICGYASYNRGTVATHRKRHTKAYTDFCDVCNKGFYTRYQLEEHRNLHTGERPFKCEFCDKGFICKSTLEKHKIATHSKLLDNVKNFPCTICTKTFLFKKNLVRHLRTHTGEKPFVCNYCGKGLTSSHSLMIHKRTHTGEKLFVCDLCGKSGHVRYLKDHMGTHNQSLMKTRSGKQQLHQPQTIQMDHVAAALTTVTDSQSHNEPISQIPIMEPAIVSMCHQMPRNQHQSITVEMFDQQVNWPRRTATNIPDKRALTQFSDSTRRQQTTVTAPIHGIDFWQGPENA
ncbi:hypothetical protein RUM43_003428 [Polyplax serrata]|uniref:C2H2-type domain-containing protein n=1 Tax=Polyplax serrata TaxID=468196 RepID=A0AAN8P298_POLSC